MNRKMIAAKLMLLACLSLSLDANARGNCNKEGGDTPPVAEAPGDDGGGDVELQAKPAAGTTRESRRPADVGSQRRGTGGKGGNAAIRTCIEPIVAQLRELGTTVRTACSGDAVDQAACDAAKAAVSAARTGIKDQIKACRTVAQPEVPVEQPVETPSADPVI